MSKFFKKVKDPKYFNQAERLVQSFEQKHHISLPVDYREFLLDLEAYIIFFKEKSNANEELVPEHIDDLFCDYYFTLPEFSGEFQVTDLANLSTGYTFLEDLQDKIKKKKLVLVGNIWHSLNYHYFLALNSFGEVLLIPDQTTNDELKLTSDNPSELSVATSFKKFLEDVL